LFAETVKVLSEIEEVLEQSILTPDSFEEENIYTTVDLDTTDMSYSPNGVPGRFQYDQNIALQSVIHGNWYIAVDLLRGLSEMKKMALHTNLGKASALGVLDSLASNLEGFGVSNTSRMPADVNFICEEDSAWQNLFTILRSNLSSTGRAEGNDGVRTANDAHYALIKLIDSLITKIGRGANFYTRASFERKYNLTFR